MKSKRIISTATGITFLLLFISMSTSANAAGVISIDDVNPTEMGQDNNRNVVTSQLIDATIFFNGAELDQTASAKLVRGDNEIVVEGLSPSIDLNSLRIKTSNNVVVASYEFSVDYLKESKAVTPAVKQLEDAIKVKDTELNNLKINQKIYTDMRQFLKDGVTKNVSGSEKGLSVEELKRAMDYYKIKSAEIEVELTKLTNSIKEMSTDIASLQQQLNQERVKGSKTSGILKLSLSSPIDGTVKIGVAYFTPLAAWSPYYDINIASTDKPLAITTKAKVSQTTGLDWKNVKLTLSTASPSNGKEAPLFNSWVLRPIPEEPQFAGSAYQNSISYMQKPSMNAEPEELDLKEVAIAPPPPRTMQDYINTSDNALNITYNIDMPYSIPGNGKIQNIDLNLKEVPAEFKYYCAPKLDTETYVVAEVPNWEQYDFMSAPANVTYDGTNVGSTYINASTTKDKLALTLGIDKRISVKRERVEDNNSSSTSGSNIEKRFTYRTTVKNNQKVPVKMITKDQYPISGQKDINVTLNEKQTTKWSANIKDLGVITWEEELAPGETKIYDVSYSVKYPKDLKLNL